jgi:DtxR family Mn-dependent transcriptional regulator
VTAPLSPSVEDYLKTIYHLSEGGESATTSGIAERLAHSPAAVTGMVKRLAESGHLRHEPYRGVRLTAAGRRAALAVVRRHRVIETFLITELGYDWASVHAEAERLEHAVSDDLIQRMASALGEPRYDPHGSPIPTVDGEIEELGGSTLDALDAGRRARIVRVDGADPERLRYLDALGMVPGAEVMITSRAPYGGPIGLWVGGAARPDVVIGPDLAATVRVSPLAEAGALP